jgi:hypothetical protein
VKRRELIRGTWEFRGRQQTTRNLDVFRSASGQQRGDSNHCYKCWRISHSQWAWPGPDLFIVLSQISLHLLVFSVLLYPTAAGSSASRHFHFSRGLPTGLLPWNFPSRIVLLILELFIRIVWPAHCNLFNLTISGSSDNSYSSSLRVGSHSKSFSRTVPKILHSICL